VSAWGYRILSASIRLREIQFPFLHAGVADPA
jgi:hypothetical protein